MVTEQWMIDEVKKIIPDAEVEVSDLHGTGDHFHVRIISNFFEGLRPLQRQKPILNHFKSHIANNTIHALDLKCMTHAQAEETGETVFDPHGQESEFFGVHIRRPKKER